MLSKKMAFSLTSLITIFALAFVVAPAMAQDFDVTLDMADDKSSADGLQVMHPGADDETIKVTVKFANAVKFDAANAFITTFDKDDKLVSIAVATGDPAKTVATKAVTLTIPVKAASYKVNIKIAEGIADADPLSTKKSKKLDVNILLVSADDADDPTVYSIRRADNPLLPVTSATVQVIVTLSEMPKEFKKGNLSISDNATIADPVALDPVTEDPNRFRNVRLQDLQAIAGSNPPPLSGLYDDYLLNGSMSAGVEFDGIHTDILADSDAAAALTTAVVAYNAALAAAGTDAAGGRTAISPATAAGLLTGTLPTAVPAGYTLGIHPPFKTYTLTVSGAVAYPALAAWSTTAPRSAPLITQSKAAQETEIAAQIAAVDILLFMRDVKPTAPDPADHATRESYADAVSLYNTLLNAKALYDAENALYKAYMAAVMGEMEIDEDAVAAYVASEHGITVESATGRDSMLHPYVVTITPKYPAGKADIVLKIGAWEDTNIPATKYTPPLTDDDYTEGVDKLTIKVGKETLTALTSGTRLDLPHGEGAMIPANGFYLLTKNKDGSGINYSHEKDNENLAHKQTPAQLLFNVRAAGIPNLETFFLNGGTLDLVAYDGTAATAAYISEVMWGSDASQADAFNSQWIEIANTTAAAIAVGEKKWALWAYQAHETPPAAYTGGTLIDRIGTEQSDTGVFWSVVGTGRSGRTNVDPGGADVVAIAPTQSLISMVRVTDAAGAPVDGTLPTSWAASGGPSVNFKLGIEGTRVATPGAADIARPTAPTPPPVAPTVPVAAATDIMITEIMVDSDSGRLPQWIELSHVGTGEVSLDGWEMVIDNAIDADVIGGGNAITVSLSGATLDVSAHTGNTGKGQSVLVVAWAASRHSANIRADRIINIATQLNQTRRYQLLSYKGFRVTLVPPQTGAIAAFGDVAGNLDEEWELPMDEGTARSSIIRREMAGTPAAKTMGTDANGWMLASSTALVTGQQSYYGADEDAGTPGQDSGGPLPVELSHFRPARDKMTGAVVITWATQSELNNAGFFIKRSNQRNGQFVVVNPTMVAGAGTTSEKQFYTYTDTTAQPNVVYYYQIEDVSLDGNRQTLTRGIRLKGHIGAAGKLTSTWGELKTSNE